MKKIVYFIDYSLDSLGGAQLSTQSICSDIISMNAEYEPVVVCPKLMTEQEFPYRIIEIEREDSLVGLVKLVSQYRKIIKKENPDIIHAQMPKSGMILGILRYLGSYRETKFIFTDRGLFNGYSKKSQWLFRRISKYIDTVICTTNMNKMLWKKIRGDKTIEVIYNCISPDFKKNIDATEHKLNEVFTIGFAGRVTDFKDWPLSISICRALKEVLGQFRVGCVMSAYSEQEKELMHNYIQQFQEILGEDFFYSIDLQQNEMPNFYKRLDAFLLTSKFESFGKTAIEAMSCDCVVLATNVGGLPEVIGVPENLYEAKNIEKCVEMLTKYATDEKFLQIEKKKFKERFNELFDSNINLNQHIRVYNEVVRRYDE